MKRGSWRSEVILYAFGLIPVVWAALLSAPYVSGGLLEILNNFAVAVNNPFHIKLCGDSAKTVLFFIAVYIMGIGIYFSTRRNTRPREEHGSAKWGEASEINRKYADKRFTGNKLLTQNVRIGFDMMRHLRNLNVLVCGGSGAGKTRFYCKPNVMNCNTSMIILDPKGEITRDTGLLLKNSGMDVKVLDLINMWRSHCYNPFVYLKEDNDCRGSLLIFLSPPHQKGRRHKILFGIPHLLCC